MKKIIFTLLISLLFCGCSFFIDTQKELLENKIVVLSDNFYDDFKLINTAHKLRNDGLTEIEAVFVNMADKNIKIAYKIDWFDKDNFLVDTLMSKWEIVNVESMKNLVIRGVSPSTKAMNYQVRVMYPKSDDTQNK
ncbi:DUF1425 domain-containing protein [Campylobacter sputorum]|uniref:DUF1425 domain-containing protein n=1 Tax=Campylobacter sputorum TaxID=206 RepID=UPI001E63DA17|nr:YcfL family protein [Campylobacter sputorum]